ncbi:MAG: FixH family protein, partial [Polyangiaceae bacterium]
NTWTVSVTDPEGDPVSGGTLLITSYMPDHAHSGPPAVAIEQGDGVYEVDGLVLPMPALYAITETLTLPSGAKESVVVSLCMSSS